MDKLSNNISLISKLKKIFFPFYKSKELKKLFKIINKDTEKKTQTAMFVGGCVRKFLNNEIIDDIDIATTLSPEELKEKLKDTEFKTVDTGLEHGSLTIICNSNKFEVTTLRKDIKTDGRHAEIEYTNDWEQDSTRRDFSINAIYMDQSGKLFDPQNGINDLKEKKIKFIGDPLKRIEEDYLRIIRFIRFSIHYNNLTSDPENIKAIKINLNGINQLSKERVLNELHKIFSLKKS
jgi:poly(A) polymerase